MIKKVNCFFFLAICLLNVNATLAQPFIDVFNLKCQYFPSSNYYNSPRKLSISNYQTSLTLPLVRKNKDIMIVGGSGEVYRFNSDTIQKDLYSASLNLGYSYRTNERISYFLLLIPKFNSAGTPLFIESFQLGGAFLLKYKRSDNLAYKVGLYYNREAFGNFFMPLLGIEWKVNPKINVFGNLPASMNIEYKLSKELYTGLTFQSMTSSFGQKGVNNYYIRNGDKFWGHNHLKGFLSYYLKKHFVVTGEAGYTFGKRFEAYSNKKEQVFDEVFRRTEEGPLLSITLSYRYRIN